MIREARGLAAIHKNVIVKIPMLPEGMRVVKDLAKEGIKTNVTLVFSANQALLAAKAGAYYVSPFLGRLDDTGEDSMQVLKEIRTIFDNYQFKAEVLAASMRTDRMVTMAALLGADIATMPAEVLEKMFKHPLTDKGIATFIEDFKNSGLQPLV
jgi:transaldolase